MNRINILLIAGDLKYSQEAEKFFIQFNYYLTIAENNEDAYNIIQNNHFDFIVCQVANRNLDGLAFLQQVQADPKTVQIPFILLGNSFSNQVHRQAMNDGADDILFSPYSFFDLKASIESRLNKNQALLQDSNQEIHRLRESITTSLPHEMRTALTGIIAGSELLCKKQHTLKPNIVADMLKCINSSAKRLSNLIHKFLLYSELQSTAKDQLKITDLRKSQTLNVKKAIAKIVLQYGQKHSREADFILDLEDGCVQISSDNLTILLGELIDNACKFSLSGTPIKITSRIKNGQFILTIIDCGRGMTSEQINSIGFGIQFNRLVYEQQGFGLGLVISQDLAQLHGGNLSIASTLDKETHVNIALPIPQQAIISK